MKKLVSVIIVHYKVKKELFECISSVVKSKPKTSFEIVVVDNDEKKTIGLDLKKRFPDVVYIPNKNKGLGEGNNAGANKASGEYLFFLNPDTQFYTNCIDQLSDCLNLRKDVAISAPLLYKNRIEPFPLQGTRMMTPFSAIFTFSIFSRFLKKTFIVENFWYSREWSKKTNKQVQAVPGTALMIRKDMFDKIGGFDTNFFMYFEENDLCMRVLNEGKKIVMVPMAKLYHELGASTKKSKKNLSEIFTSSRFYYLKKHFGVIQALAAESILRLNKYIICLGLIIILDVILRSIFLPERMTFIGDQGWFYLSARDMIIGGKIPLVGITSSHTWLHQGPLWTYLLIIPLWLFSFNPTSGVYLTIFISVATLVFFYLVGKQLSSPNAGLIAAFLYSASPYFVIRDRMPYHTSPIPFFMLLLFYSLNKVAKGSAFWMVAVSFCISVLYGLELATVVFIPVVLGVILYGFVKKEDWFEKLINVRVVFLSLFALVLPMIPILIYDLQHGFPQTIKYSGWFFYKLLQLVGIVHGEISNHTLTSVFSFFVSYNSKLIFIVDKNISLLILAVVMLASIRFLFEKTIYKAIIFTFTTVGVVGFFIVKTPSEAYLPMIFPGLILIIATHFSKISKHFQKMALIILLGLTALNMYILFSDYLILDKYQTFDFEGRIKASRTILKAANGKPYNLNLENRENQFPSAILNYSYLTWWIGRNPPSKHEQRLKFIINETTGHVEIKNK